MAVHPRKPEIIPAKNVAARRHYIEQSPNLVASVEELRARLKSDGMSLGAIRPKEILGVYLKRRSAKDISAWHVKEAEILSQQVIAGEARPKPLDCPEAEFHVEWRCDDAQCNGAPHDMTLKSWQLHELYRKLAADPLRDAKVTSQMERMVDLKKRDVFLFLGTMVMRRYELALMDAYSTERVTQLSLLGGR